MLATRDNLVGKRYEVQSLLGPGGMGAVYRVRDRLTGELVALKRVVTDRVTPAKSCARGRWSEKCAPSVARR